MFGCLKVMETEAVPSEKQFCQFRRNWFCFHRVSEREIRRWFRLKSHFASSDGMSAVSVGLWNSKAYVWSIEEGIRNK